MLKDLQFAWRTLRAKPVFTAVALLSLALGIGANTAIFTVVESSLLRGLPYPHAERLVQLGIHQPCCNFTPLSPGEYHDYSHESRTLSGLAAFAGQPGTLTGRADAKNLQTFSVTTNYFEVLGAKPEIGRLISPKIDKPSADTRVAVLPKNIDDQYDDSWMQAIGRLKPGYTIQQSAAEVRTISASIAALHPKNNKGYYALLKPLQEMIVGNIRPAILTLLVAVILLLLIACANLAGLLLARATGRSRELAIRIALGASRWELMRLLLSESVLLAIVGGALGIILADISIRLLVHYSPYDLPAALAPNLNFPVLAFCVGVTLVSALLSGLLPALNASRVNVNNGLKDGSKGIISGGTHRLRRFLAGAEIAVSVMLLIGASLLIHSFSKLTDISPGFNSDNVLSAKLFLPHARYPHDPQIITYWHDLLSRLNTLPGVRSAGLLSNLPMAREDYGNYLEIVGQTYSPNHLAPYADFHVVSARTFDLLHVPLISGRMFNDRDDAKAPLVAVINKHFADKYFPNESPLGKRFKWENRNFISIVGVVGDMKYYALDEEHELDLYLPYAQKPVNSLGVLLRSKPGMQVAVADLRNVVHNLDANIPLNNVQPLGDYLGSSLAARKFLLGLLTTFSGLVVLLAAIGLYAVLAYSVQQRRQEIGVRVALGATSNNVLWLILRECLTIAILGTAVGLLGATWTTSFLKSMLYGITDTDLTAYAAAIILSLAVAIVASLAPALRATRIDPLSALRYE